MYHLKACLNTFQMSTNVVGFNDQYFLHSDFGDKSRPVLKGLKLQLLDFRIYCVLQ
jgi:hypothetical protein